MPLWMVMLIGLLFALGFYLLLQQSLRKLILGLAILSNATNLLVFGVARLSRAGTPIVGPDETAITPGGADPLPQALILTAIVIGFGVLSFFMALAYRTYTGRQTDELWTEE